MRLVSAFAALVVTSLLCARAAAQDEAAFAPPPQPRSKRDIVVAYNTGLRFSIAPGVFIPLHGPAGFSISGDVRYGIEIGPVIVAPGIKLAGYFPSDLTILAGFATARVTWPLGPVGPYVLGGLGPGWVSSPSNVGLAWLAGGGLMVYIGDRFGIGAEATYQAITGTNFQALFVGPSLLLAF
jgi:hypothetical protein